MSDEVMFIGDSEAGRRVGPSVATIWRKVKAGDFPTPVRVRRRTLWRADEITQWIERETNAYRAGRRPEVRNHLPTNGGRHPRGNVSAGTGIGIPEPISVMGPAQNAEPAS